MKNGHDRATDTAGQTRLPQARGGDATAGERRDVRAEHLHPLAIYPKGRGQSRTVHDYRTRWNYDGTIDMIHHALDAQCREAMGAEASPTACVIDSQSVKSVEKGGPVSFRPGMTRVRRSEARSGISWSTR